MSGALSALATVTGLGRSVLASTPLGGVLPPGLQSLLLGTQRQIGSGRNVIIPDCTIEENHQDRVTVTQHPVARGSPIADHVYRHPYSVTMRLGWTNANPIGDAAQALLTGGIVAAGASLLQSFTEQRVMAVYAQLRELQFSNTNFQQGQPPVTPFKLTTGKRSYENMVLVELSVRTDRTTEYSLMVEARFEEVMIVSPTTTTQPAQTDQASPSQTASPTDQADKSVTPKTNPRSTALQIDNMTKGRPLDAPRQ